jgi:cell wall-associated NlpC family hydrolase
MEVYMDIRLYKAGALVLTGTFLFIGSIFGQDNGEAASDVDRTGVAGVSETIVDSFSTEAPNSLITAGISQTIYDYMTDTDEDADVSDLSNELSAAAEISEALYGYTNLGIAQVDEGNLNIRVAPGTDSSLVGKLPNNAGCEILDVDGEWTHISSGEVEGYVKSEYLLTGDDALSKAAEVKQTIATVTTTTLYVREEPSTESTIITSMPNGEELEVIEVLDGWVKINVDSDEGYVSADYVDISTDLKKAMTMTEVRFGQGVSDVRVDLVSYATQFVGNPYVWGGTSLTRGADCSGFVLAVFSKYGISLPHSSSGQSGYGTKISASQAQPGDLFFYGNGKRINHVAIYIGNGQVVHASSPKSGIKISSAYYRTPVKVVSILN